MSFISGAVRASVAFTSASQWEVIRVWIGFPDEPPQGFLHVLGYELDGRPTISMLVVSESQA